MKKARIFIGPCEIAGYYANLAKGFKQLGLGCDYITYTPHPFGYGGETAMPKLLSWSHSLNGFRTASKIPYLLRGMLVLLGMFFKAVWVLWAVFKYDVFIFGFGQSLTHSNADLWWLRLLGKTVISNLAHGSESRPVFIDGAYLAIDGGDGLSVEQLSLLQRQKFSRYKKFERYSSYIIGAAASTVHFAEKKIINTLAIGIPFSAVEEVTPINEIGRAGGEGEDGVIRILHSPSHPVAKGSMEIRQAISNLVLKGYNIEFVLVHGRPHSEVIDEILRCDFVVDQIFSDAPLAGFATEAAWFGKPAVVGGYSLDILKNLAPQGMCPVSKTCMPDGIQDAIEQMIVNREERLRLGREAKCFVREVWNATEVARRYKMLIDGSAPANWWLCPDKIYSIYGAGQPLARTKNSIRQMVEAYGADSLCLAHNPELESAFLGFANSEVQSP